MSQLFKLTRSINLFQARAFKKFIPMFDRVLVERFAPEVKTKSGIMIPEKAQGKVLQATVVATGQGAKNEVKFSFINLNQNFQ